ncbi:MAG: ribosome silencing factor [Gammaproteobacteria bacterium]|jgi:ribosome-associated protein|nr:ribosome silencing factor [Gammaproteobacteria bacterium]
MTSDDLQGLVMDALDDLKGQNVLALDVSGSSSVTDWMVIASGTSGRHVKSLVDRLIERVKAQGVVPIGVEGQATLEWVLVDLGDVVVHVMQKETRTFYDLERLWRTSPASSRSGGRDETGRASALTSVV